MDDNSPDRAPTGRLSSNSVAMASEFAVPLCTRIVTHGRSAREHVGYPERFAQEALGHNSKAVHRSYAKRAEVRLPSLEQYERDAAGELNGDASNWWIPDTECVLGMLRTAGFTRFSRSIYPTEGRLLLLATKSEKSLADLSAVA